MTSFNHFWERMKLQRLLFALCWRMFLVMYLGIGIGALAVVFVIETQFFMQITHHSTLSYVIAGILESAKVGTSLIKQALAIGTKVARIRISVLLRGLTAIFQIALIGLSLICCVIVMTSYLDGTYEQASRSLSFRGGNGLPHPMVFAAIALLQESFGIDVTSSVCISVFALLLSTLLQSTVYIAFGHILATQANEIEHLFTVKLHKMEAKKNFTANT